MKAVIQRVDEASVTVNNEEISKTGKGILVLLGVEKGDTEDKAEYIAEKISCLRIFEDDNGRMNLSVKDVGGEILAVSQFTLAGNVKKGRRPSFDTAMAPEEAGEMFSRFIQYLKNGGLSVKEGIFQTHMKVSLTNNGPVTFIIEK